MKCWICKRTEEDLKREGISEHEFEEFDFSGKTVNLCGVCSSIVEEIASSVFEENMEQTEEGYDETSEDDGSSPEYIG